MLVTLTKTYAALPYDEGTVENLNRTATVELSDTSDETGGLTLRPGEKFIFNKQLYARSAYPGTTLAVIASAGGSGGDIPEEEIATDEEVEDMIDNVLPAPSENTEAGGD